jgi:hypothetical protein
LYSTRHLSYSRTEEIRYPRWDDYQRNRASSVGGKADRDAKPLPASGPDPTEQPILTGADQIDANGSIACILEPNEVLVRLGQIALPQAAS